MKIKIINSRFFSKINERNLFALSSLSSAMLMAGTVSLSNGVSASTLEEVVVTATRREESMQSIPASIAAVSGAELEGQGISDFKSVSETISGVTLDFPTNAINAAIYMRGVGTTGASTVQSVSTMIDGVYQIRQGLAFTELMDIERVEVLRGPQGTLFGKNSTSGAIRIFTANPDTQELFGKVQGVAGNLGAEELRGMINIPLIEGQMAARVSAYTSERDGYTDNVLLGKETRNVDREGWRAKLLWDVTDNFQVKLTADNHDQATDLDSGITRYGATALDNANDAGVVLPPVSIGNYQENIFGQSAEEVERYIVNLEWSFTGHTLSTISSWEDNQTFFRNDRDETAAPGQVVRLSPFILAAVTENTTQMEVETHELQLASDHDGPLSYIVGYYFQRQDAVSITSITPIFDGSTPIKTDSQAFFTNMTYTFNDTWSGSVGVRRDEDERTGTNEIVGENHTEVFEETTYSLKLTYQYDPDKMFYLSHDKGFKSGGVNRGFSTCRIGICLPESQAIWDPEIAYNYEVGMKTEWLDNRLRINAALFFTSFEDFQVTQNVSEAVTEVVSNAAEVEAKGIEIDFTGVLGENLTINGSATYVESTYVDYKGAPCAYLNQPGCTDSQDLSGKTLDHAPELSFNLGAEYRDDLALVSGIEWFGRVDVIYKGEQNLFTLLPEETEEDAYTLLNARLGFESVGEWKLTFWGKNLADEEYRASADTEGDGGLAEVQGLPRTYGVTADWYF